VWGAGLRGANGDEAAARDLLLRVRNRVKALVASGREAMATFERQVGDAVITYENELLLREMKGRKYGMVIPSSTIRIDNPVALIDANVEKHGNREVVEAFIEFLRSPEAQRAFAEYGFRSVLPDVQAEFSDRYPEPADLFTIDDLGGWTAVRRDLFSQDGIWAQVNRAAAGR
jgi:sulfate transport system substrate-binding protein